MTGSTHVTGSGSLAPGDGREAASAAATPGAVRHGWPLVVLLVAAGTLVLPHLFDARAFKTATLGLLAAVVLVPAAAVLGRDVLAAWFGSWGGRLLVLSVVPGLLGAWDALEHATVIDRVVGFGLAHLAAVLGLLAASRGSRALLVGLGATALVVSVAAWSQALGWDTALNDGRVHADGQPEVVGLSGNSTRAAAVLALGLAAMAAAGLGRRRADGLAETARAAAADRPVLAADRPSGAALLAGGAALALVAGALLLTRGRAAWAAALVGVAAVAIPAARGRGLSSRRLAVGAAALALGAAAAFAVAGPGALSGRKTDDASAPLAAGDRTTAIRAALFEATGRLVADQPLAGVGLGRFRGTFGAYRDPDEAALPGLEGAATEATHPHNELLLVAAECGVPGALALLAFLVLTWRRAWRAAHAPGAPADRAALGLIVAGTVLAMVQDAWTAPGAALPFFAAAGWAWAPRSDEARAWERPPAAAGALAVALGLGLGVLAWPRLDTQMSLRSFYLRTVEGGFGTASQRALLHAAEAGAGDIDTQRLVLEYGPDLLAVETEPAAKADIVLAIQAAEARLEELVAGGRATRADG